MTVQAQVRRAHADEVAVALALRHAVFVVEQGVALAEDVDGLDAIAEHLVAVMDGEVVATCRLLHEHGTTRLGRMAVAPSVRRRGLASALLALAEDCAREAGSAQMLLHAQTDALGLYERAAYTASGARFEEADIEHLTMTKSL